MNKLLSQNEVDSLLKGLDTGEVETADDFEGVVADDFEAFDWATSGLNVRGNMPLLEVLNSRLANKLRGALSNSLRKLVDIAPDPLETEKYGDFQRSLPVPTSMHLFKIEPLRGTGIIVVESRLVFGLVEAYFGGTGTSVAKIEGRDFTLIENKIIKKLVQMTLSSMAETWEEVYPLKLEFIRSESNPLVVNVVPREELLLSSKFEIELNRSLGNIVVSIPYASVQPIRHKLAGGYTEDEQILQLDAKWINQMQSQLLGAEVGLNVNLGRTNLSVKDYLNLREGDIIVLENDSQKPILAETEGIPLFEGYAGRFKNRKVFKVDNSLLPKAGLLV